jgi:hypothetical protein
LLCPVGQREPWQLILEQVEVPEVLAEGVPFGGLGERIRISHDNKAEPAGVIATFSRRVSLRNPMSAPLQTQLTII